MMDHAIDEMEIVRSANEQKVFEIQRINGQLNKALEVNNKIICPNLITICFFI
jgi:hypothetical protein